MVNVNKLKGIIIEKGYSISKLSDSLSIDKSTFYRKLNNNGEDFSIKEADRIANILNLSYDDMMNIFFAQFVA